MQRRGPEREAIMKIHMKPSTDGPAQRLGLGAMAVIALAIASQSDVSLKPLMTSTYVTFLGFSRSIAGFIIAAEATAGAITVAVVVSLLHRLRSGRTVVLSAALVVLGNALSCLTDAPYPIAGARILAGVGHGAMAAVCAAAVATFARAERVSALVSVSVALLGTGLMIGIPLAQGVAGSMPLFIVMAVLVIPPLVMLRWIPRNDGKTASLAAGPVSADRPRTLVIAALVSGTFFYFSVGSFWPYAAEFGKLAGLSYQEASLGIAGATVAAIAGSMSVMFASARFPKWLGLGGAVIGAMVAQALLAGGREPWLYNAACIGFMFCWGVFYPLFLGILSELDRTGRANGYFFTLAAAATAVAPALAGLVIGIGAGPGGNLNNLLWMSISCLIPALGVVVALAISRTGMGRATVAI